MMADQFVYRCEAVGAGEGMIASTIYILWVLLLPVFAFGVTGLAYQFRRTRYTTFARWWDTEGMAVFLFSSIAIAVIALSRGCIR
jgi:hypothetical protein